MRAIQMKAFGGPEVLHVGEWQQPVPGPEEVLVRVRATAINRADTLQRKGKYPAPPGESPILGLEMAGEVVGMGTKVSQHQIGDRVCGLLGGGGHAEYVVLHEAMALPIPGTLSFVEAAAIPEVFLTAFQALGWLANLQAGEKILIHAGASGVGTAAIQLAREMGASDILVTASAGKHALCQELGANFAIDYHTQSFAAQTTAHTNGYGVDVIVDFIAAPYFQSNLNILATDGRLVLLALLGGTMPEGISLAPVLRKRLHIMGSTLRSRDLAYKIRLSQALKAFAWQAFAEGRLRPVIDQVLPWTEIAAAHRRMEANQNAGKIVLEVS